MKSPDKESSPLSGNEEALERMTDPLGNNAFGRPKGNIIIDSAGFGLYRSESKSNIQIKKQVQVGDITDKDYLICPPSVLGFSFKRKDWDAFNVSRITPKEFSQTAFDSLVIDPRRKTIIKSFINQHSPTSGHEDIIDGKGRGIIGIFAGGPSCGRMLTVEAVAEETQKPLYTVTVGELGFAPEHVDNRLRWVLDRTCCWNAILLLNEADVFLQKRSAHDLSRNAMVSSFLRQLEYFKGIMILTTNCVEDCDPAFESMHKHTATLDKFRFSMSV
ncbi:hypothetical protein LSUB1_G008046 [Lachnellula subtilissima]|uniref:ATPase AAA-type core domain-containing protein n=1 Tax=Lachnellula subtilissima TaxID=602034 RepID=A0A8H8RIX1_9HELO|nr:hypothetical protein LSUB1_G008046 [Lachnellula subtilissima]